MSRRRLLYSKPLIGGSTSYASAAIGNILLSDKSYVTVAQWNAGGYLPAIGVIFGNSSGVLRVLALTKSSGIKWDNATTPGDLSLTNYDLDDYSDINGLSNTATIVAALGNNSTHAAGYCYNYTTDGTVAHDWYLPAFGEGKMIIDNFNTINTALSALSASLIKNNTDTDFANNTGEVYWCSTELDSDGVKAAVVLCYSSGFDRGFVDKNAVSPFYWVYLVARPCLKITY